MGLFVWAQSSEYEAEGAFDVPVTTEEGYNQFVLLEGHGYLFSWNEQTFESGMKELEGDELAEATNNRVASQVSTELEKPWKAFCVRKAFLAVALVGLPILVVIVALTLGLTHQALVIRMFCMSELAVVITFLALSVSIEGYFDNEVDGTTKSSLVATLKSIEDDMGENGYVSTDDLIWYIKSTDKMLYAIIVLDTNDNTKDPIIVCDSMGNEGIPMSNQYGLKDLILKCADTKESAEDYIYYSGYRCAALSVYNWEHPGLVTIGIVNGAAYGEKTEAVTVKGVSIILVGFFMVTGVLEAAYLIYYGRWKKMINSSVTVIREHGEFEIPEKGTGGMMPLWMAVSELCKYLENVKYGMGQSIKTALKFMPLGLETLVGKKDSSLIAVGDFAITQGSMIQFSLDSMKSLPGQEYMNFVEKSFSVLGELQKMEPSVHVQCDADFTRNKYFFSGEYDAALNFAMEASRKFGELTEAKNKKRLFLINSGGYFCGISGTTERAIPVTFCKDDEILDKYETSIRNSGLEVVLTENVLEKLKNHYSVRYIGYIKDPSSDRSIKLYECLDVYIESKRKLIIGTEEKFQRALNLFYSDDFYLARNTFNEVLQMNPTDQITRWYLFSCEFYLNDQGKSDICYGLYENSVLEKQYRSNKVR